jgi:Acetyltransferase (GNAT) domain
MESQDKGMEAVMANTAVARASTLLSTYDELVNRSPQGSIFAHRWWLDAVAPGMYEILEIKKNGGLQAAWPVVHHEREGANHVRMPALTQKLGILFAPSNAKPAEMQSTNQKLAAELINQLGETASFHQNFHENFTDWLPFYWGGFSQTTRYTYVFDDISDTDILWNNLRQRTRTEIRKAQKLEIQIKDDLDLAQFLDVIRKTFARQDRDPLAGDELVYRLDAACAKNARRKIFAGVDRQGRVHAAVYVVWANNTAYTVMGGGDPEFRNSNAYRLACWEVLISASSTAKRVDLMGSMLPQVEPVFRGLGARQVPYSSITKTAPHPTSVRGFLKAAIQSRWSRGRRMAGLR